MQEMTFISKIMVPRPPDPNARVPEENLGRQEITLTGKQ